MRKIIFFLLIILFISGILPVLGADDSNLEVKINSIIEISMNKNRIPGMAVSAVKNGEIVYSRGFNQADGKTKITADSPIYIGSISKSFTALAIMQLVEAGEIDLDDPVKQYVPFFNINKGDFEGEITVKNLLNHRSGMTEMEYISDLPEELSIEDSIRDLSGIELSSAPGEEYSYFNPNYNLLGLIIENVSGMSYEDYIKKNVLNPLEMNNTYLSQEEIEENIVEGYGVFFSFPIKREEDFKRYALPSGYIVSTAQDMAHYLLFQQTGEYKGKKLLSDKGLKTMQTSAEGEFGYGMGWKIGEKFDYRIVEHGGSLLNYSSNIAFLPEKEVGVVLLVNQNHAIYNTINNNQLSDNILHLLLDPAFDVNKLGVIPLKVIFLILAVIALLTIAKNLYQIFKLDKWSQKMKEKSKGRLYLNIALNFVIPLFLIVGIPLILKTIFNRGVPFVLLFNLMPGIVSWVLISSVLSVLKGILKIYKKPPLS